MVPRVAKPGRSFKGAAAYYLHDKQAQTADRVAFTETRNLPTDDPRRAVAHMIDTAAHAEQLKLAAGVSAGRKLQKPVYSYSLAWHPDQAPTMQDQLAAARETLGVLGLEDRQALIVGHNDTAHPHVHVIVNRVCPETGKAASTSNDHRRLQAWALEYERRHGQVLCVNREGNAEARRAGEQRQDRSSTPQDHRAWKKQQSTALWAEYRAERDAARDDRRGQFDALWQQREERFAVRKDEIKALFKPQWRDLFQKQRQELGDYDASMFKRIGFALSHADGGKALAALRAALGDHGQRRDFLAAQAAEKSQLGEHHRQAIADAGREITKAWKYDRDQLRSLHREQDAARLQDYRSRSDDLWNSDPFEDDQDWGLGDAFDQAREPSNDGWDGPDQPTGRKRTRRRGPRR